MFSVAYYSGMDRVEIIARLIADEFGGKQAELARKIDRSPAQISQWLTGRRAIGDASAINIEAKLKKPGLFHDLPRATDHSVNDQRLTALLSEIKNIYKSTSHDHRDGIRTSLEMLIQSISSWHESKTTNPEEDNKNNTKGINK